MIKTHRIVALLIALVLAGCAAQQRTSFPPPEGPAGPTTPTPSPGEQPPEGTVSKPPSEMPPRTAEQASSPAVLSLLGRADALARAGHMDMAAATLERALDLEPRNPFVYQQLASIKLAQGQAGQAEAMAGKSNSVAGDNPFVRADNWRLIAEARRTAGDRSGADDATARAQDYANTASRMTQ